MSGTSLAEQQQAFSPIPAPQLTELSRLVQQLTPQQLTWASGYLAGLGQQQASPQLAPASSTLTVLYASHTGNGKTLAQSLAHKISSGGQSVRVVSATEYKPRDIGKEDFLVLIVSTHGEGEPPESALELHQFLNGQRAPKLDGLKFSVFALGDSSYEFFCQAGRDFDRRLQQLGGERVIERVDADIAFQPQADAWIEQVEQKSAELLPATSDNVFPLARVEKTQHYHRGHPYHAQVLESRRITSFDAVADVHHLELAIDAQAIRYQPGDSLGIWAHNDPALVDSIMQHLQLDSEQSVTIDDTQTTLRQALSEHYELTLLHPAVVQQWLQAVPSARLENIVGNRQALNDFAHNNQFIDLISAYPGTIDAETLLAILQPIQPRLYSIASSQQAAEDEVHLTVSALRYQADDQLRQGTASTYLVDRLTDGQNISIYVVENESFRLPNDAKTPVIMIGAGTGIAPFRAFLQQREADNAGGSNWLIFGNRHFHRDFLYQNDWLKYRNSGLLDRIDLAFSRDAHNAAYVQDRLAEQAEEVYRWIQQGAVIYVCGNSRIDDAVQQTLTDILAQHGELDESAATEQFNQLRIEKRYLRDVY